MLDGLVVLARRHLERHGAVLGVVALRHDVPVLLEQRQTLLNGRAGLLVEFVQLGEMQGVLAVERDRLLQFRDGPVEVAPRASGAA